MSAAAVHEDASAEVTALAATILSDVATSAEGEVERIDRPLWDALAKSGLTDLADAGWPEAAAMLTQVGAHAARVPVAEHDLLAAWLLATAGLPAADGIRTAGLLVDGVARVPWASECDQVVLLGRDAAGSARVWAMAPGQLDITPGVGLAGEPRDLVALRTADRGAGAAVDAGTPAELRLRLALARSLQCAGAAAAVTSLVTTYTGEREQFGRPIARFQAVQELVSSVAAESTLMAVAAASAVSQVDRLGFADLRARVAILSAGSCAGHGAAVVARNAHQALGAMGYTREHPLHRFTNRMLAWRSEPQPVSRTDADLLALLAGGNRTEIWSLLVDAGTAADNHADHHEGD